MSNFLIALLFSAGCGGWVYNKVMKRTGGNAQTSVIGAVVCGIVVFIVFVTALTFINPSD